jgi:hypothetical protein
LLVLIHGVSLPAGRRSGYQLALAGDGESACEGGVVVVVRHDHDRSLWRLWFDQFAVLRCDCLLPS